MENATMMKHDVSSAGVPGDGETLGGRPAERSRCGMTLVEVMVAVAVLATFLAVAIRAVLQTAETLEFVRRRTEATALAWSRIERARHVEFNAIDDLIEPSPGVRVDATGVYDMDGFFRRVTTVTTYTNGFPMKRIRVDVSPQDRRKGVFSSSPQTMETIIADVPRSGGDS